MGLVGASSRNQALDNKLTERQAKVKRLDQQLDQAIKQNKTDKAQSDQKIQQIQKQIEDLNKQIQAKRQQQSLIAKAVGQANAVSSTPVQQIIISAANEFGLNPGYLLTIARCESGFNPRASNGTHFGLFQFLPSTYAANAPLAHAGVDYWDATKNARTAAYMLSHGQAGQWQCKG